MNNPEYDLPFEPPAPFVEEFDALNMGLIPLCQREIPAEGTE